MSFLISSNESNNTHINTYTAKIAAGTISFQKRYELEVTDLTTVGGFLQKVAEVSGIAIESQRTIAYTSPMTLDQPYKGGVINLWELNPEDRLTQHVKNFAITIDVVNLFKGLV